MPSIAELLLEKARQQGQMWNNIGRDIAAVPATIAQAQEQNRRATLEKIQVQNAQDLQRGQQTLDQALTSVQPQGPTEPGQAPLQPTHPYLDDQGLIDPTKVQQLFNANGLAHVAPDILDRIDKQNSAITNFQKTQQQLKTEHAILLGRTAHTALSLMDSAGFDFPTATTHAAQPLIATKVLKPEDVQGMIQQGAQLPPDQQRAVLTGLVDQADQLAPTKTLAEGAKEIGGVSGKVLASNAPKPPAPSEASLAADAANLTSPTAAQSKRALDLLQEAKKENKAGELKFGRVDGKGPVVAAVFDPGSRKLIYRGLDVTDRFQAPEDPAEKQAAAVAAQVAQQSRAQNFQQLIKAKEDLEKNVITPYITSRAGAQNIRELVQGAQSGNTIDAVLQNMGVTIGEVRSQGLNRLNAVELGLPTGAGSLFQRIEGYFGGKILGKPVPEAVQKDMLKFADQLEQAAYKKYTEGHKATNALWGTKIEPFFAAPQESAPPPQGQGLTPGLQGLANR